MTIVKPENDADNSFPVVIVDFAHNALSLKVLLETLHSYFSGKIICVLSGTDRLQMRRAPMGEIAGELADFTVITSFTSEQTQSEDILEDFAQGMRRTSGRYSIITDRREAIKYALSIAEPDDIIVINAKGINKDSMADETWDSLPDDFDLLHEIFDSM
jgi:UDP-N-acetylmuramoyl-L-alanyl-D-glutamate--2,6-diaminopimelate ligase